MALWSWWRRFFWWGFILTVLVSIGLLLTAITGPISRAFHSENLQQQVSSKRDVPSVRGSSFRPSSVLAAPEKDVVKPNADDVRFVYLVSGASSPAEQWRQLSKQRGVHVLYAVWRDRPKENTIAGYPGLLIYYFPKSTWTTTRNFLFTKALEVEKVQGVRFNFLLFADDDVTLGYRHADSPKVFNLTASIAAFGLLQHKLEADQPARASVEFRIPISTVAQLAPTCAVSCAFDGAVDIYHRSIAPYLLPYSLRFDKTSWPMAQLITNLRSQALAEVSCNLYRNIFINAETNAHSSYPLDYSLFTPAAKFVSSCLAARGLPLSPRSGESLDKALHRSLSRPKPGAPVTPCSSKPRNVDYAELAQGRLKKWPVHCPF